ncbi:hypothetical protein [Clostridium sp. BNL1100]|uniref:hypothetical protein n=1 Tax=Clostridium sp. BNL1100 TaxID=755731 RepID=UPI00024A7E27|nr:hypothetical protein [Clostridium sp. BNL1100]AEY66713.1 hypothetical protein Clo1100_2547 [Clostridium sp. BNL1100]
MSDKVIITPDITPEERLKRLNNVGDVLSRITGHQCKYVDTEELLTIKPMKKVKSHKTGLEFHLP